MGRLIDESEAIELIKGSDEITGYQKDESITCIRACKTAYDPDKVEDQLNDKFRVVRTDEDLEWNRAMDEAITLVKGGGVDGN